LGIHIAQCSYAFAFSFSIGLLAFSIIITGFVVASAMIAGAGGGFLWMRLPFLEIGFGAALIMGAWLLLAIFRSGRL
jgi:ubiquinone biosynthesis protein